MYLMRHAGRASRLLSERVAQHGNSSFLTRAAASDHNFLQGRLTHNGHVDSSCSDLQNAPRNASTPLHELQCHIGSTIDLCPPTHRHVIQPGNWALLSAAGQRRHCSSLQPPPFPQPKPLAATGQSETDCDKKNEADHAKLSEELVEQHGQATNKLPLDAFSPLGSDGIHSRESVSHAASILKHAGVAHLREELEAVSERQATIPYKQLLKLIQDTGVAGTVHEAQRIADALCTAGVVLRFRAQVYLRPDEVAHSVLSALPDTLIDLENKASRLEADLLPLQEKKQQIDRSAYWRSKAVMWTGFSLLVVQWSVFYWLTWYELSWDVMEPVAYFVSLGMAIGFYLFFLLTNEPFDYRPFQQKLFARWQQRHLNKINFDQRTFDRLQADLARYRRYITHFKRV